MHRDETGFQWSFPRTTTVRFISSGQVATSNLTACQAWIAKKPHVSYTAGVRIARYALNSFCFSLLPLCGTTKFWSCQHAIDDCAGEHDTSYWQGDDPLASQGMSELNGSLQLGRSPYNHFIVLKTGKGKKFYFTSKLMIFGLSRSKDQGSGKY